MKSTYLTKPNSLASSAVKCLPVKQSSLARLDEEIQNRQMSASGVELYKIVHYNNSYSHNCFQKSTLPVITDDFWKFLQSTKICSQTNINFLQKNTKTGTHQGFQARLITLISYITSYIVVFNCFVLFLENHVYFANLITFAKVGLQTYP